MSTPPKATPTTPIDDDPPQWAMQRAAQAWCASTTKYIEMDPALCREFAHILAEGPHAPPPAAQPSDAAGLREVIEALYNFNQMWFKPKENAGGAQIEGSYGDNIRRILAALAPYLKGEPGDSELLDWLEKHRNWWAPKRHVDGYEQISRAKIRAAMRGERGEE